MAAARYRLYLGASAATIAELEGSPVAGGNAVEANIDFDGMTRLQALRMMRKLRYHVQQAAWPPSDPGTTPAEPEPEPEAPEMLSAGTIGGTRGDGNVISGTVATASGIPLPTIEYRWFADDALIEGETGFSYTETALTEELPLRREARGVNSEGATDWVSSNELPGLAPPPEDPTFPGTPARSTISGGASNLSTFTAQTSVSVPAGHMILVNASVNGTPEITVGGTDTNWTLLDSEGNSLITLAVYYWLNTTGSPVSKELVLNFSVDEGAVSATYIIPPGTPGATLNISGTFATQGSTSSPNPPSHNAGAARDHLWLAIAAGNGAGNPDGTAPTDYGDLTHRRSTSNSAGAAISVAERLLNAQTEDPAGFAWSGTAVVRVNATLAVWEELPEPMTAPVITDPGTISGTRGDGNTITGTAAAATGDPAPTLAYQWQVNDGGWANIVGATAANYADTEATEGFAIRRRVVATNPAAAATEFSNTIVGLSVDPTDQIATTMADSVTVDGITFNFSEELPVGWYGPKRPFVVNADGVTITSITPASYLFNTATGGQRNGWVNGAELNPGCAGSQRIGKPNSSADRDVLHGLDERGSTSVGTNSTNFEGQGAFNSLRSSPPELTAGGYYLNRDPGFTGAPIVIPAGTPAVIGKAWSNTAATVATDRLHEYAELCIVSDAPPLVGALPLGAANPDLGHRIYASDIDLTGVQNLAPPAGFDMTFDEIIQPLRRPYHQNGMLGGESQRYNRGRNFHQNYGRRIAHSFSNAAMMLHTNMLTTEQKQEVAYYFVMHALSVRDRMDAGGNLTANLIGAQQHYWSLVVAIAAWLTRNSARGQIFRDLMPGGDLYSQNLIHLDNARAIAEADWTAKTAVEARNVVGDGSFTYYEGLQCRPHMEGSVWAYSERGVPGSGIMSGRFAGNTRAYPGQQFLSNFGMARFLAMATGGRATINRADFWKFYDILADIQLYHRQFGNASVSGPWYREGSIIGGNGSCLAFFDRQAFSDNAWQWPQPALSAPAVDFVGFSSYPALQERKISGQLTYEYKLEQWVWIRYSEHLSRQVERMPVKTGITITVNGQNIALDEVGCRTAGDPRTNGAIQIRGRAIAFALATADMQAKLGRQRLLPTDTVLVTSNFTADSASRPRTIDNQWVPDVTAAEATWVSSVKERPETLETVSFGGRNADDQPKLIQVFNSSGYLSGKFGIENDTVIEKMLIGARLKLAPGGLSRVANAGLIGRGSGSTLFSIRAANATAFTSRYTTNNVTKTGGWSLSWGGEHDDALLTLWWLSTLPTAGGTNQLRRGDTTGSEVNLSGGPGDFRWSNFVGSSFGVMGFASSSEAQVVNPLRAALREFYVALGTPLRPLPAIDLTDSVFSAAQDWGSRGQNILPGRADYAGEDDDGIPEFYFCPKISEAEVNSFPNYGVWSLLSGTFNDPDNTLTWFNGD